MLNLFLLSIILSSPFSAFTNTSAISVGRDAENGNLIEICSGVAISPNHAVTLFAFTNQNDVFVIEKDTRIFPDSILSFRDMGLVILIFNEEIFPEFEQPRNVSPPNGAALLILADHPTGLSAIRSFPMEHLDDGALLLASPPASELMGAPVFDAYDRLVGIVTGSYDPGDGRGELMALLPCNLWYYWVESVLDEAGLNTKQFGVTAMPATSGLSAVQGILLLDVEANSVASDCGLLEGDIITEINNSRVYHPEALKTTILNSTEDLSLTIERNSTEIEIIIPVR